MPKQDIYLHTLGGHAGRLVKNLKLVPARGEGVVADKVLQGRLLQPAGAEGGAAVGVLEDGVATRRTFWREACKTQTSAQEVHLLPKYVAGKKSYKW